MAVPVLDRATLDSARKRAAEHRAYWNAHRAELTRAYPDEFVAVWNGDVIDHDPDLMVLARRLQSVGVRPDDAMIEFMASQPETFLL